MLDTLELVVAFTVFALSEDAMMSDELDAESSALLHIPDRIMSPALPLRASTMEAVIPEIFTSPDEDEIAETYSQFAPAIFTSPADCDAADSWLQTILFV